MPVPVVEVGGVGVRAGHRGVVARVGVPDPGRQPLVQVVMVAVVVAVAVRVVPGFVRVLLSGREQEVEPHDHRGGGAHARADATSRALTTGSP